MKKRKKNHSSGYYADGSKASSIAKAGRSYGLEVSAHRYGVYEVKENVTYPAIIHWNFNHFGNSNWYIERF